MPRNSSNLGVHRTASGLANLANLLPTGNVLAFQALVPSFSNYGQCETPNKYLTACLIAICSLLCFLSSFTDSFNARDGKICYGIATFRGFCAFNPGDCEGEALRGMDLEKLRISFTDIVHAVVSLFVFLVFAFGSSDVQGCYFHIQDRTNLEKTLMTNLPLGVGFLSSFLFTIFPTRRRGIGCTEMAAQADR